jgi:hypothetical protein
VASCGANFEWSCRQELAQKNTALDARPGRRPVEPTDALANRGAKLHLLQKLDIISSTKAIAQEGLVDRILRFCMQSDASTTIRAACWCVCTAVHTLQKGQSMTTYESDCAWAITMGTLPKGVHYVSDNSGREMATCADTILLQHLRDIIHASPFISIAVDDSARMEQCCIVIFTLQDGRRVPHLLKMHALPGALVDAESICTEIIAFLCGEMHGQQLQGEGYGVAGLSRSDLARKLVGIGSDGAPWSAFFGKDNGVCQRIIRHAPHAVAHWCASHRVGLAGRDLQEDARVARVHRVLVQIAQHMNGSVKRVQTKIEYMQDADMREVAIRNLHDVRWLSVYSALLNVLKQYGPLVLYFFDGSEWSNDEGAQCRGIASSLCDVKCMLLMHGMVALVHPVYKLCKALQCADSGLPDVIPLIETALQELRGLFLDSPPCAKEGSQEDGVHAEIGSQIW